MKRGSLWNFPALLLLLLSSATLCRCSDSREEEESCPSECTCNSYGALGLKVKCNDFHREQWFDHAVSQLDISNTLGNRSFVLEDDIFSRVQLKNVNIIKITHTGLQNVSQHAFRNLLMLNVLNLSMNHLQHIHPDTFVTNKQLRTLSLRGNPLSVPKDQKTVFLNMSTLTFLDISQCGITELPNSTFAHLQMLEVLLLASNNIKSIDNGTFSGLDMLQDLDLSDNNIRILNPHAFDSNTELTALYLNSNPLTSLEGISIPHLLHLEMIDTRLTTISEKTFLGFPNIVNLNLMGNRITSIHEKAFENMPELLYVDLSRNYLKGPLNGNLFMKNFKLETLSLSDNPNMKSLPGSGFQGMFSEFYKLDLHNCGIISLDRNSFRGMDHLTALNLSSNGLEEIRSGILPESLYFLDLSHNLISNLDLIKFPRETMIRKLILKGNPVEKLNPITLSNLQYMTFLDVSSCDIERIWDGHIPEQMFPRLETLMLANNNIKSLTSGELEMIGNLRELDLINNPMKCDKTFSALINWLKERDISAISLPFDARVSGSVENSAEDIPYDIDELNDDDLGWDQFVKQTCSASPKPAKTTKQLDESLDPATQVFHIYPTKTSRDKISAQYSVTNLPSQITGAGPVYKQIIQSDSGIRIWVVILTTLVTIAITIALVIALIVLMRWMRQREIYNRNSKLKRTISSHRLKKQVSSYEQLHEDFNAPTTPMMSRVVEDDLTDVHKPEIREKQPRVVSQITYLSSKFHHSNIVPQSV
ncbi:leucine-rich repeat-containing protein 15 [Bacillus rossius redtenbacheri]|uniref:leucine-rich repeat-containing protein 15 n=1 Tax=Bacillus rossius redtenbacheri TaxID=93214 RepID=UPI002FDC9D58